MRIEKEKYNYCLVCKKRRIPIGVWICDNCYRYLGREVVSETIEQCGSDYSEIPKYISENQHDYYFVRMLKKKRAERGRKRGRKKLNGKR